MEYSEEAQRYMQAMMRLMKKVSSKDAVPTFDGKESDVIVTAFPKSGSAIMQQMCYQIAVLSGGAGPEDPTGLEYSEISAAVPWIEMRDVLKIPPSKTTPRVFKTHFPPTAYETTKCRHVVIIRDPSELPSSLLNFLFDTANPDAGVISDKVRAECVDIAAEKMILKVDPSRDDNLAAWHAQIKDCIIPPRDNVLILFYEDVTASLQQTVRAVAKFMNCTLSQHGIATVAARCSREYMVNNDKFKGRIVTKGLGIKKDLSQSFPPGRHGFKQFKLHSRHHKVIEEMNSRAFGVSTYTELREIFGLL